jgi:hypothetical protein
MILHGNVNLSRPLAIEEGGSDARCTPIPPRGQFENGFEGILPEAREAFSPSDRSGVSSFAVGSVDGWGGGGSILVANR